MSRLVASALLAACIAGSSNAHAQARGPSARQVQEAGQEVRSTMQIRREEWERDWGGETRARERDDMRRDSALSAEKLAGMDAFLRRLSGRFRIEGKIERMVPLSIDMGGSAGRSTPQARFLFGGPVELSAKVTGVADCSAIGEGAGVNCIISATWPVFDRMAFPELYCDGTCRKIIGFGYTAAELFDTMRPAVLTLGLDTDPPQLRAMLVTADTLTNEWAGRLDGNHGQLMQTQVCTRYRCFAEFGIEAEPDGEVVTFTFRHRLYGLFNIALTMHRDPQAQLEKALKPMRAR